MREDKVEVALREKRDQVLYEEAGKVVWAANRYAGSFFRHIAEALLRADGKNAEKIRNTWRLEWDSFVDMYDKMNDKGDRGE